MSEPAPDLPDDAAPLPPWQVALAHRWRSVSGVLLDPITLLGLAAAAWGASRAGAAFGGSGQLGAVVVPLAAALALAAGAFLLAEDLLFARPENELLRAQPLGPTGLLRVRLKELRWWLAPGLVLAGSASWAAADVLAAAALALCWWTLPGAAVAFCLRIGAPARRRVRFALAALGLAAAAGGLFLADHPLDGPPWLAALPVLLVAALGTAAGAGLEGAWVDRYDLRASEALSTSRRAGRRGWRLAERLLPLPPALRARLLRDFALLSRGRDVRGAALLSLSPLSCLYLADELVGLSGPHALPWRALTAAALGGAGVAYAMGPGIHLARSRVLAWERGTPRSGRRSLIAALLWAAVFASAHGLITVATVALAAGGRFAPEAPSLLLPVLGLELALAHFVVAFTFGASTGRRIEGEGTLALMLPAVAVGVALVAVLWPWAVPLYFVVTAGMLRDGIERHEALEVTW